MKKIILAILMSLVIVSCGNTSCSETIEYNETFVEGYIHDTNFERSIHGSHIIVEDSIVTLRYSTKDNILHVEYNGSDHTFKNVKMSDRKFVDQGIECNGKLFMSGNDTIFISSIWGNDENKDVWIYMNMSFYYK